MRIDELNFCEELILMRHGYYRNDDFLPIFKRIDDDDYNVELICSANHITNKINANKLIHKHQQNFRYFFTLFVLHKSYFAKHTNFDWGPPHMLLF